MTQIVSNDDEASAKTPKWKRISALFSLSSLTILLGIGLAVIVCVVALLLFYGLENAAQ